MFVDRMEVLMSTTKFPPPVFLKAQIGEHINNYNSNLQRQVEANQITVDQYRTQSFPTNAIKQIEEAVSIAINLWDEQQNAD